MSDGALDPTVQSFPPYADLTKTEGWNQTAERIHVDGHELAGALATSERTRYSEGPMLGAGGMGKVVLARDVRIGRDVAVKAMHAERELDPDARARFLREAQVQGQLEHPSIVPVYDIERRPDGSTFFTMRRVHGVTLAQIVDELRRKAPEAEARHTQRELLGAFATVCLTVHYAHTRGVVHRDLKPSNIMLGEFGEVYVLDWGLAHLVDEQIVRVEQPTSRLSMPGSLLGTPMYMAPEQMSDPDVTLLADVYSLGLILYEILTLESARDREAIYVPVDARPTERAPHRNVAPELEKVCVTATAEDPAHRYPSARAMQEAIARYLEGDRELEQRRQLAAKHVEAARMALRRSTEPSADQDKERGTTVTELGRALALDPTNTEYLAMIAALMSAVPSEVPAEVAAEIAQSDRQVVNLGARFAVVAMTAWWLFVPVMWWIGFADTVQLAVIVVPGILAIGLNAIVSRSRWSGGVMQSLTIASMLAASAAVSRMYGSFIVAPTLIATFAIVLQTHPERWARRATFAASLVAFAIPVVLEWSRAVPASYVFEGGRWVIVPQLLELPRNGTFLFIFIATLAAIVGPVMLVARLRTQLSEARSRLAVQAWHFKQLGAQLIGQPHARPRAAR